MRQLKALSRKLIGELFEKTKMNLLGPRYVSQAIVFSHKKFDPSTTLMSAYTHALSHNAPSAAAFDADTVRRALDIADDHLNNLHDKVLTEVHASIDQASHEIEVKRKLARQSKQSFLSTPEGKRIQVGLSKKIRQAVNKADAGIDRIVAYETANMQNLGAVDGIIGMAKSIGIADPNIFKIPVKDNLTCKYCKDLWLLTGSIPRVYKLSELKGGYFDRKDPQPTISPTHPNCRCSSTMLSPGFGFDSAGKITWKGNFSDGTPWDEYEHQKSGKT